MSQRASLTGRLQAVAEGLLHGAVAKVKRGEPVEWSSGLTALGFVPTSAATGRVYKGVWNSIILRIAQAWGGGAPARDGSDPESSYSTGWWATYKQWEGLGAQVRKGEKSAYIFVPRTFNVCDAHSLTRNRCGECQDFDNSRSSFQIRNVFNADQVEGWNPPEMEIPEGAERVKTWADQVMRHSPIDVRFDPLVDVPHFTPSEKRISMPPLEAFENAAKAESTFCHELAHATSVLEGTERELKSLYASRSSYAREELIAESSAWLMGVSVGRAPSGESVGGTESNTVEYLTSWAGNFAPGKLEMEISSIAKEAVAVSVAGAKLIGANPL